MTHYTNYAGVKKKVEKIMSALHDWPDVIFDPVVFPSKVSYPHPYCFDCLNVDNLATYIQAS